jgi:DNA-3-methyladenine glycosylase II
MENTGQILCQAPFDFSRSLQFLDGFGPMAGEQRVGARALTKALVHEGRAVAFTVSAVERAAEPGRTPALGYRLHAEAPLDAAAERAVAGRIAFFLGADEDLAPFYRRAEEDRAFAPLARALRGLHHVKFMSGFEAACWGAINQRIPRSRARAIKQAITRALGHRVTVWGDEHWAFPTARAVADAGDAEVRRLVAHPRKAETIAALARAFVDAGAGEDERALRSRPLDELERWLLDIRGVGPFTKAFVLFRGFGRASGQPRHPTLVAAAERLYRLSLAPDALDALAASFGEWSGYWALYLWASTFLI